MVGGSKVKRILRMKATVNPRVDEANWSLRLEGRILDHQSEDEVLTLEEGVRFLEIFEKVKIEFDEDSKLQPVEWNKTKSSVGALYDCINVERGYSNPVQVKLSLFLDNSPKKFMLSKKLQNVLGVEEETRARIVAALWQYIKSNRLQDAEDRRFINLNCELSDVFDGLERIEFHQIIGILK